MLYMLHMYVIHAIIKQDKNFKSHYYKPKTKQNVEFAQRSAVLLMNL